MFENLIAEQARKRMTDEQVAKELSICRMSYVNKKSNGKFTMSECKKLCSLFNCSFEYLFASDPVNKSA